jgi:hypothetical protein
MDDDMDIMGVADPRAVVEAIRQAVRPSAPVESRTG